MRLTAFDIHHYTGNGPLFSPVCGNVTPLHDKARPVLWPLFLLWDVLPSRWDGQ